MQAARLDVQKETGARCNKPVPVAAYTGWRRAPLLGKRAPSYFLHAWFPRVHDVLHADWQEVWHSRQPPVAAVPLRSAAMIVLICLVSFLVSVLTIIPP